ncbi:hypothetical protein [Cysteiniphilum sp. JM-1]|uniref:hypothetical protein n=1 Tax=Cysteiniphilum sp. JM-1 TaxID=2610891 RepID=UPI0012466A4A|nr:hypothetical protein [Cysteiniphilum sp. JM-1]
MATNNPKQIMHNVVDALITFYPIITIIAVLIGVIFIIVGMVRLTKHGKQAGMRHYSPVTTICYLLAGTFLVSLNAFIDMLSKTVFGADKIPYNSNLFESIEHKTSEPMQMIYVVMIVVGVVSIIRGMMLMTRVGEQQHSEGMTKVITHLIAGVFAINLQYVISMF